MKHFTLLSLFLLSFLPSIMAYDVTTEVQKKNILIEEFTGIHCGYCPQAHIICHNLEEIHQGRIFSIAVHSGYYAVPGSDQPDYRTTDGDLIDSILGTANEGRPCGVINRLTHTYESGATSMVLGRSAFGKTAMDIMAEDAPVNLLIKAECDVLTRKLNVTIEGYCTADVPSEKAFLSIVMTQDNIVGPQNGAGVGDQYVHQSMLRDYLTPVLGDEITIAKDQYFSKSYTFELPKAIIAPETNKTVDLILQNINLIAFVTEDGKNNIMNVTSAKPTFSNFNLPLAAELSTTILGKSKKYGFNFFEVILTNKCNETLTSAQFDITINGNTQASSWEGEVAPFAKQVIRIPYQKGEVLNNNTWKITITKLNNQDVESSELSGSFSAPTTSTPELTFAIQTDYYAEENLFRILDADGNVVEQFEYEPATPKLYTETIKLDVGKIYCFEIVDICADGIYKGSYKINNNDGKMVEQNYSIPDVGCRTFFVTSATTPVDNIESTNLDFNFDTKTRLITISEDAQITLYSITGAKVVSTFGQSISLDNVTPGIYFVQINSSQKNILEKIMVK
ncbi:MAG: Omp28-related outer membrane protein [Paludibacteraceae bacterium]|nr:Omp28-related outer membrane protein [Paludibacteraceae bacterium]